MKIQVDAFSLIPSFPTVGTAGSYGIPKLEFIFSEEWKNLSKKCSFYDGDDSYVVLLDDADTVVIPFEIMENDGEYSFIVSGCHDDDVMISLAGKLKVLPTETPAVTPPGSPTPSEMEQIYDMLAEARDCANSAVSSIDAARTAAADASQKANAANSAAADARVAAANANAAAESVVSVQSVAIDENGHLKLTMTSGAVRDAGSARGCAVSDTYIGNGSTQEIVIGMRPAFLVINKCNTGGDFIYNDDYLVAGGDGAMYSTTKLVEFTDTGFILTHRASYGVNELNKQYRYYAFNDDCTVLSSVLAQKASRPPSPVAGDLPLLNALGNLTDSGKTISDFAPGIQVDTAVTKSHTISDSAGYKWKNVRLYGDCSISNSPSKSSPSIITPVSSPSITASWNGLSSTVHATGVTLAGYRVNQSNSYNMSYLDGTTQRYCLCDTLDPDGRICQRINSYTSNGNDDWRAGDEAGVFYLNLSNCAAGANRKCICTHYESLDGYSADAISTHNQVVAIHGNYPRLILKDTAFSSPDQLKSFLRAQYNRGTPLKIWYEMEAYLYTNYDNSEINQLTIPAPHAFVLSGAFLSFTYMADTKRYIEKRISEELSL